MLQKLIIRNYAIIDYLELEPDGHLNTVTGETGAGKSIILGALSLILGERADTSVLINKDEKCIVEAHFNVKDNEPVAKALQEEDIEQDPQCIIRREIGSNGKSRAFINDSPVTLNVLNEITSLLVDLQQQFGHLALEEDLFQVDVLDAIAKTLPIRNTCAALFAKYRDITKQLSDKQGQQQQWQKEADYKKFLFDELEQAAFKEEEIEQAEQQLKQMSHAERIHSVLSAARTALDEGDQPLINELKKIGQQLQGIKDVLPDVDAVQQRIASVHAELKDIADELSQLEGKVTLDGALMEQLQERMDLGYKLLKKHGLQTTGELLALHQSLQQELKATLDLDEEIANLTAQQKAVYNELLEVAEKLSAQRTEAAPEFVKNINELLVLVGMPNARFEIKLTKRTPTATGIDDIKFLLDANKSGQLLPLQKAASGGEMSRIMLCIKSLTARAMHLPTLIFDEVDTGISGEAARQVALLLRSLAQYHQVICITHQPQVAARGSKHFYVYKDADGNKRITTKVKVLQKDERVLAIARMIGGEQPSEAALQNARELVS